MGEIKFTIRMIAAYLKISIEDLAEMAQISPSHLKMVSAGKVKMTAKDIVMLSKVSGIPSEQIQP